MGFLNDMAGIAAKGIGISARKVKVKKEVEALRLRAEEELATHDVAYKKLLEFQRKNYFSNKEHYIVSYMFSEVMINEFMSQRNFNFFDRMPTEYRNGAEFKRNLLEVENEYYEFVSNALKDGELSVPNAIFALKDLLYFEEIREEVKQLINSEAILQNEMVASASVFTQCGNIEEIMQKVRDYPIENLEQTLAGIPDGITVLEEGDFKRALKCFLYCNHTKADFDQIKIALLHFAHDEEQDELSVEAYDALKKICRRIFGLSIVKTVDGIEKVCLYPSVDMVIAELLRHIRSGIAYQYEDTLRDWLDTCGNLVDSDQLTIMQEVFFYLKAFKHEQNILEYIVKNNMARTAQQDQRLKFLREVAPVGGMNAASFSTLNIKTSENTLLYDHRFLSWKTNEVQQYFTNLTLMRESQVFKMVIDEWQKDVNVQGVRWNNEQVVKLITASMEKNFGNMYDITIIDSGAAVEDWVDVISSIYIYPKDDSIRNAELSFLIVGEQMTDIIVHLTILVLLSPNDQLNGTLENEPLCKKVIAVKEKHNPRVDTFISTIKNILITQLETWINQFNNSQEIY